MPPILVSAYLRPLEKWLGEQTDTHRDRQTDRHTGEGENRFEYISCSISKANDIDDVGNDEPIKSQLRWLHIERINVESTQEKRGRNDDEIDFFLKCHVDGWNDAGLVVPSPFGKLERKLDKKGYLVG